MPAVKKTPKKTTPQEEHEESTGTLFIPAILMTDLQKSLAILCCLFSSPWTVAVTYVAPGREVYHGCVQNVVSSTRPHFL